MLMDATVLKSAVSLVSPLHFPQKVEIAPGNTHTHTHTMWFRRNDLHLLKITNLKNGSKYS